MLNQSRSTLDTCLAEQKPVNLFGNFFDGHGTASSHPLLDTSSARRWFRDVSQTIQDDTYTYQQPFDKRSGNYATLRGRSFRMLSSYDYLGLIGHDEINEAAIESIQKYGTGTGGVRLLTGSTELHRTFEEELAAFKGTEASITFSSGYVANVAAIASLMRPEDLVIIDARAHRSITDACRLAHVPCASFRHNDPNSLEAVLKKKTTGRRKLIIVEGIYSMDGDICPLPEIVELKNKYGANLMIDEAHSFGVMGTTGRGIDEHYGIAADEVNIWMGTLSKAIPSVGGFIAAKKSIIIYLQHGSAPYMFSAACAPPNIAAAQAALRIIENEPWRINRVRKNEARLRSGLQALGFDTGTSCSPVIPVILGENQETFHMARSLFEKGIIALGVVNPAVARGEARLRLCATASQDDRFIDGILNDFEACSNM
jgi:8-amino-7-oxononanoate synthase